jgi:trehalose 6-phosphate synthase/phosphatase
MNGGAGVAGSPSSSGSPPINRRTSYISLRQQHQAAAAAAAAAKSQATAAGAAVTDPSSSTTPAATTTSAGSPVQPTLFAHEDGDVIMEGRRGHAALYSGITSLREDLETIQIGWVGELADQDGYIIPSKNLNESHKQAMKDKLWQKDKVVPIFLDDSRAAGHYEGYCKSGM